MLFVSLRGLAARRLRAVLTATAVVLGVGLIAGTYILTDTINRSFDAIFEQASKGVDVSISPRDVVEGQAFTTPPAMPVSLLERVRSQPGVRKVAGGVFAQASIYDRRGKRVGLAGAPNFVTSPLPAPFEPFTYAPGRAPRVEDEVALDRHTVEQEGYRLGELVPVAGNGPQRRYRLVGVARYGDVGSLAGAAVAILTLPEAQRVTDEAGRLDNIYVQGQPGVTASQLSTGLRAALPASVVVRTGREESAKQSADARQGFSFIKTLLLVFAGVALFVGAFMIFNTFSITVAQRTREFALLRTIGASRRQVLGSVVAEAGLIGALASVVGLGLGFALAPGLNALFKAVGAELPGGSMVLEPRTVVVSLVVGTLITLLAGLMPALRATRVAPIAALREGATLPPGRFARLRTPLALALSAIGVALLLYGLFGSIDKTTDRLALLGVGAVVLFLAVAGLAAHLVRPLAWVVGGGLARLPRAGVVGRLAQENAARNPIRTATTAAALMIGLALVTFVAVFAAGIRHSVNRAVDRGFTGALVFQNANQGQGTIPAASADALRRVPGIGAVSSARFSLARVQGIGGRPTSRALILRACCRSTAWIGGRARIARCASWAATASS